MRRPSLMALGILAVAVAGCARLSEADAAWCTAHREEVREAARELGAEDDIDWPMQGPPSEFDARYAQACLRALEAQPAP